MAYIPNTPQQRDEMLAAMGKRCLDELLVSVPSQVRLTRALHLPGGKSELEVLREIGAMAQNNMVFRSCFRGAGAYRHFIPAVVRSLSAREEFVTAYTPYQAELSQGVLQTIFEYQTTVCELTGMDVSNAGVYDGAHAAAEAVAMFRERKRLKTVVSATVKPITLEVIKTYCRFAGTPLEVIPANRGKTDADALAAALDDQTACVYMEQPNYFGLLEDADTVVEKAHAAGAKLVMGCYPTSLAVLKTPAEYGADAAVGEAQPLGLPLSFGGPYLGYMAVRQENMRRLPGRVVGQTTDKHGNVAYVLTLQAREQHIRREKAGSSICSNEALCALTATIYCAAMGKQGLREVASQCMAKARYAADKISSVKGYCLTYDGVFFNEFVTACPTQPETILSLLAQKGILGGLPLGDKLLWCVTEMNTEAEIDELVAVLKEAAE